MIFDSLFSSENIDAFSTGVLGGMFGFVLALGILIALIFLVAVYVYVALAWYRIAREARHKNPWLAWIPFANGALMLQLGRFHWAWIFLVLIPIVGWIALAVLLIIATWRVFEKRGYPGWFALSIVIPKVGFVLYLVALGFVAWKPKHTSEALAVKKKRR